MMHMKPADIIGGYRNSLPYPDQQSNFPDNSVFLRTIDQGLPGQDKTTGTKIVLTQK